MIQKAILERFLISEFYTLGRMVLSDSSGVTVFKCYTLELPYKGNKKQISCIPANEYQVVLHASPRFGVVYKIQNVDNRSEILIHKGNYINDTKGCILVGRMFTVNNTGNVATVLQSTPAFTSLMDLGYKMFNLKIVDVCR